MMPSRKRGGQFESSEPATQQRYKSDREQRQRDEEEIKNIAGDESDKFMNRLGKFSDKFHELHSEVGRTTRKNPLFDLRKDPITRFQDYLESEWNTFGDNIEAALVYAEEIFQTQGDDIAGNWNKE